jgi:hypothetical protein
LGSRRFRDALLTIRQSRDAFAEIKENFRGLPYPAITASFWNVGFNDRLRQSRHGRFCTASEKAGIRRRVRIQDAQLTAAKVSNPGFRGKARNSPDISKGISQSGMCKFESSEVGLAVASVTLFSSPNKYLRIGSPLVTDPRADFSDSHFHWDH